MPLHLLDLLVDRSAETETFVNGNHRHQRLENNTRLLPLTLHKPFFRMFKVMGKEKDKRTGKGDRNQG